MSTVMYKDFGVERTTMLVYAGVALLFGSPLLSMGPPLTLLTVLAVMFTFTTAAREDRYQSHVFINSLPVTRREVVTAQYVFHLAVGTGFIALGCIYEAAFGDTEWIRLVWQGIGAAAFIVCYNAFFFPLYYWLGPRFVQIGMRVMFIVLFAVVPLLYNIGVQSGFWGIPNLLASMAPMTFYVVLTALVLMLVVASWRVSVWLYERKEF